MDIITLLARTRDAGAGVQAKGGRILYDNAQRAPEYVAELRKREGALLTLLEAEAAGTVTVREGAPYQPDSAETLLARIEKGKGIIRQYNGLFESVTTEQQEEIDIQLGNAVERLTALMDMYVFHYGEPPEGAEF